MTPDELAEASEAGPGLGRLLGALTASPEPAELAGETEAMAMFRASFGAPVSDTRVLSLPEAAGPAARRRWPYHWPVRWLAAAAVVMALLGGTTAAAYAAALPPSVQHVAHVIFGAVGVPDAAHPRPAATPPGSAPGTGSDGRPGPSRRSAPGRAAGPEPSASPSGGVAPAGPAGSGVLTVSASGAVIPGGGQVVISGQLTLTGGSSAGSVVELSDRQAGQLLWRSAGLQHATSGGDVAFTVGPLTANTEFRLQTSAGARSASLLVRIMPSVTIAETASASGRADLIVVSTQDAAAGNRVWLEAQTGGAWVPIRSARLTPAGRTAFVISTGRLHGRMLRALLLPTTRHTGSVSATVTAP